MYDICCIGHITLDTIITPAYKVQMPGGTSFYFSTALARMPLRLALVTALAPQDEASAHSLEAKGITVHFFPSATTLHFENTYPGHQDFRVQRVLRQAQPFRVEGFPDVKARYYHCGPLLEGDIPDNLLETLASRGTVSLDVQGYLRRLEGQRVVPTDWPAKRDALRHVHILKADDVEMQILTGLDDIREGAAMLYQWGPREVIITLGSQGSIVFDGTTFYDIPAYPPEGVVDATGCGDTYMAGYLFQKSRGADPMESGKFGAAMATLKLEQSGPFTGTGEDVEALLQGRSLAR